MGLVLDVIGNRDGIQPSSPRFINPHRRPNGSIGEHGVEMKIATQGNESVEVGEWHFGAGCGGGDAGQKTNRDHGKVQKKQLGEPRVHNGTVNAFTLEGKPDVEGV
jgi:hypothetical protein